MLQPTQLFPIIVAIGVGAIVAIFWLVFSTIRKVKVARMQAEIHSKLIEKISSTQEFLPFLNSEAGRRLVASISSAQPPQVAVGALSPRDLYRRILRSVRIGAVLLCLGIGLLIVGIWFHVVPLLGGLFVALGAGFLISAGISYHLSKKFGLLDAGQTSSKLTG